MNARAKKLATFVVLAALVVAVYFLVRRSDSSVLGLSERAEAVRVAEVTKGSVAEEVLVTGEVEAMAQVALAPKVGGRLMALAVEEGQRIAKGALAAELDKDTFQSQVESAQAAVEVARAGVRAAETTHENVGREYQRAESLFKQGTSAQSSLDSAESAWKVAAAGVDVAKASLQQAEAALRSAEIALREASIYAPFDAVVAEKLLDVGSFVAPGQPVLRLVSIDTVKVSAGVDERSLAGVEIGTTPAVITVDACPGRTFPGSVALISPTLDSATRTADVDVHIANASHLLRPGMFARVTLVIRTKPQATLIPSDALLGREGDYYAYVVEDGRARRARVETGLRGGAVTEIVKGLEPGAVVVTSGEGNLVDGAPVGVEARAEAVR